MLPFAKILFAQFKSAATSCRQITFPDSLLVLGIAVYPFHSISYSDFALAYSNSSIISCSGAFVSRLTMITNTSDTKNAGSSS